VISNHLTTRNGAARHSVVRVVAFFVNALSKTAIARRDGLATIRCQELIGKSRSVNVRLVNCGRQSDDCRTAGRCCCQHRVP
jgi:hypothetical protein